MCLLALKSSCKKAKRPVKVYKVLREDNVAPFLKNYTYKPGINRAEGGPEVVGFNSSDKEYSEYVWVSMGYLHAYRFREEAEYHANATEITTGKPYHVVEMYVPEGEEYYSNGVEIAARALVWDEINDQ